MPTGALATRARSRASPCRAGGGLDDVAVPGVGGIKVHSASSGGGASHLRSLFLLHGGSCATEKGSGRTKAVRNRRNDPMPALDPAVLTLLEAVSFAARAHD